MTQSWRDLFVDKIVPADRAVKKIKSGSRIFIGSECGTPQMLVRAFLEHANTLADIEVLHLNIAGDAPYASPKYAQIIRPNTFFVGDTIRQAVNQAEADYTPAFLSQIPAMFKSRRIPIDVALIAVSTPDEHGYCSLGVAVDITKSAAESAKVVIAQVNANMPRTLGDSFLHVEQIHCLVEGDEPLPDGKFNAEPDESTQKMAANVARLVTDGATLQIGVGRIPDAVLATLTDKHDLGVHSEMISTGMMRLAGAGVITGKCKTLNPGKIVGSFVSGNRQLFDFVNRNLQIEMHPAEYVNDPTVIARHDNMVAINSALAVDLTGQVSADSIGTRFHSGLGGHADFIRGAALAKNGKPIVVLPSTYMTDDGVRSRITASLPEGTGVVGTRGDIHYVVTEYGTAYLHGKSIRERAMSLITIAHPDFRSELLHAAKHRRIVYANQIMPPRARPYPAECESTVKLRNDCEVSIRPIRADDEPMMKDMFYSFSEQTVYLRYHGILKSMPHNRLQVFCNVDYDTEMALIGTIGTPGNEEVVAVGRYMTDAVKDSAELAFVVRDDWQHKGLGTQLFNKLLEIARSHGIFKFSADVLIANSGMLKIFHRSGLIIKTSNAAGVVHVSMSFPERPAGSE